MTGLNWETSQQDQYVTSKRMLLYRHSEGSKFYFYKLKLYLLHKTYILRYYSTNCNTIQIWSWCSRYLSSVGNRLGNRYPAICVASYVGRKREVKKCRQKDLKMLRAVSLSISWIIKQLSCSISRNIVWFKPTRPTASSAKYQTIFRAISQDNC